MELESGERLPERHYHHDDFHHVVVFVFDYQQFSYHNQSDDNDYDFDYYASDDHDADHDNYIVDHNDYGAAHVLRHLRQCRASGS